MERHVVFVPFTYVDSWFEKGDERLVYVLKLLEKYS